MSSGLLIVVSGPAGVGKGTVVSLVREKNREVVFSVSATSRKPRPGEIDGVNYFFVSREQFEEMIRNNNLLEWVEYCGNYYGTPKDYVEKELEKGKIVLLEIDVEGAQNIKKQYPKCVTVFIKPPTLDELRKRITKRGTEPPDIIERRMHRAQNELMHSSQFDHIILNDTVKKAADRFLEIICVERNKLTQISGK
ncbi:MAG: guanylate kinase [Clostridiaceae bacterium]|jgi:guanylate kinase|nr:guanylate kinase [Clostridiaceae bacterium]